MALVVKDRVQETTVSIGTGSIILGGAVAGFQSFSAIGNGNATYYTITDGTNWEVGIGTYTLLGLILSRDTVLESSNGGSLVNFGVGTKQVFCTYPAERSVSTDATNTFTANQIVSVTDNTNAALRVTQLGTGNAFLVEDEANPDATPFVIAADGKVGIGTAASATIPLTVAGTIVVNSGGYRVYANDNRANGWYNSTGTTTNFQVGYDPVTPLAYIQTLVSAPLRFGTNNTEQLRLTVNGGVSFGSSGTAYGTSGQVLQSNGDAAPTWVDPSVGGMTLLGTLNTTSGSTQTLSGLTLTGYVELEIIYNSVSTNGNSVIRINGSDATAGTGGSSGAIRGIGTISLVNGAYQGNGRASDNVGSQYTIFNTGVTTASTSITFTSSSGTFDAGSILVYGVK